MNKSTSQPLDGVLGIQQALDAGVQVSTGDSGYASFHDITEGRNRYWYTKVINGEAQVLVTFGQEEPVGGLDCYTINYSVSEKHRGKGLAVEAVNVGIEDLKNKFRLLKIQRFYVDAVIEVTNTHSINVAKKIFPAPAKAFSDAFSGKPSLIFYKLIVT